MYVFLAIATTVNMIVKKIVVTSTDISYVLAITISPMFNGKLINNAMPVSTTASLNAANLEFKECLQCFTFVSSIKIPSHNANHITNLLI